MRVGRGTAAAAVRAASIIALALAGLLVLSALPATAAPAGFSAAVCPQAPPGMQGFANQITGWVKWGVLVLIVISAVVSLGAVLMGRIFSHPHASRYGAMGVAVTVMVAITYTVILVILNSITGSGCT
ncbi:hypothetical protein [Blastococcus sp. TF02A-26]|uniref:hypothetical protein n=1 Tax=Blastococcus sp. TF02A-26 TaxID=2250577 RepID=UPI000DEB20A8|nr:hypothetical protein [Blastococcus sp. TF02A-26]RBY81536.1 hypothetical protein DQ240_20310 [Blastococcus sp. TF02A-26]